MAKDYAKRVYTTSRKPQKKKWRGDVLLAPVLVFLCLAGYVGYKNKTYLAVAPKICLVKLKSLFEHKKTINTSQKHALVQNDQEAVHFEFYNTLPKMKVNTSVNEENTNSTE
jgi:hypothetical protein